MSTSIIRPENRMEWLKERGAGIGSSDVGTILGLNPYKSPYQLWRERKGLTPREPDTYATKRGHFLEDSVRQFWEDATGLEVIKRSQGDWLCVCNENPVLRVSPDRTFWLSEHRSQANKGILEIKTSLRKVTEDDIPLTWFSQVQYQLGVTEMEHASLAWLNGGFDFGYVNLDFDGDYYAYIVDEVMKFWNDCIIGGREPAAICAADVMAKYAQHTEGKIVEVTDEVYGHYSRLKEVAASIKELEGQEAELKDKLMMAFGDAEAITFQGRTLATWKAPKPSEKFDSKAFKADNPELAAKYTAEVQGSRRFLLK